jgi:transcription elongation factor GreA
MEREPISAEGYHKLREEIRHLEADEMPKVARLIAEARAEGDLRENAEYHGQRENQGRLQAKINQLKNRLANCVIVDRASQPKGVVAFGSIVSLNDLATGISESYELVGPGEEDYDSDVMKILLSGPLGKALQGKKVGDEVEFATPRGKRKLSVTKIANE